MRKLKVIKVGGKNSLNYWWKFKNPFVVARNFIVIEISKFIPSLALKRIILRSLGMKIGKNVGIGLGAQFDIFYPELLEIGNNTIIGYDSTILCHEFLINELRIGKVKIGKNVMVGTNSTILPGIEIGDNSVISACSLVNKSIPAGSFAGGVPIRKLRQRKKKVKRR